MVLGDAIWLSHGEAATLHASGAQQVLNLSFSSTIDGNGTRHGGVADLGDGLEHTIPGI